MTCLDVTPHNLAQTGALQPVLEFAKELSGIVASGDELEVRVELIRRRCLRQLEDLRLNWRLPVIASVNVLADLIGQGWSFRVQRGAILGERPSDKIEGDVRSSKRQRLLVRRNEQLREPATREFIRQLEAGHYTTKGRVTIFSLMRDGRELAESLTRFTHSVACVAELTKIVDPFLQFVSPGSVCPQTGYLLQDIWRYFRHTWSNPYESVPGRSMVFLVRDRATPFHCVIGIGALSSAAVQLEPRDAFIGWHADSLLSEMLTEPTDEFAEWVLTTINKWIDRIYIIDFVKQGLVPSQLPANVDESIIQNLRAYSAKCRDAHRLRAASNEHKSGLLPEQMTDEDWEKRAHAELFQAKRALEFAALLDVRNVVMRSYAGVAGKDRLVALLSSSAGRKAFLRLAKSTRSTNVGTAIADLTVCGAIPPYNELLAGKLVAMLAACPEVIRQYRQRYSSTPSWIASSMAGKRVARPADLVFIGTTSLYGIRPNQYDRIAIPGETFGNQATSVIYKALGEQTEGVGSFQFSKRTKESLERYFVRNNAGRGVNNVFGEGANPKLRAIRDGLTNLGFDADTLLTHGLRKTIYGANLVTNLREYLLGFIDTPSYRLPLNVADCETKISHYWLRRWVEPRLRRPELSTRLRAHTLVHPIRHGARVSLPDADLEQLSFLE